MNKELKNELTRRYRKTPKGVLTNLYSKMRERTRLNNLQDIDFTLEYFHSKYLLDPVFLKIYDEWAKSGYEKMNKPSIDRINPDKGYSRDNIQMMTWHENRLKGDIENAERITTAVEMFDLKGNKLRDFESVKLAVKETGIDQSLITMCCQGTRRQTNGFTFKYRGDKFRKKQIARR